MLRTAFSALTLPVLFEAKLDEHILGRQRRQACRLVYVYRADKNTVLELDEVLKSDDAHDQYLEWEDAGEKESSDEGEVAPQDWSEVFLGDISDDEGEPKHILVTRGGKSETRITKENGNHSQDTGVYDPLGLEEGDLSARVNQTSFGAEGMESNGAAVSSSAPGSVSSASEMNSVGSAGKKRSRMKTISSKFRVRLTSKAQKAKLDQSNAGVYSRKSEAVLMIPAEVPREAPGHTTVVFESQPSRNFVSRAKANASLDLTSENFDPGEFLWNVHYNQSLDRLRLGKEHTFYNWNTRFVQTKSFHSGLENLDKENDNYKQMMKKLVQDNFDDFVHCRHTIDQIYKLMQQEVPSGKPSRHTSRRTPMVGKSRTSRVQHAFKGAELIAKSSFEPLIKKRRRIQKLRRALELLSRSELVWKVPEQVRQEIRSNRLVEATLSFCSSSGHLKSLQHDGTESTSLYRKAVVELEERGLELVERLLTCFDSSPDRSVQRGNSLSQLDALSLVLELKAKIPKSSKVYALVVEQGADPVCVFINKQETYSKEQILQCDSHLALLRSTEAGLKLWEDLLSELNLKSTSKSIHKAAAVEEDHHDQRTNANRMLVHIRRRNSSSCTIQELANRRNHADHWVATLLDSFSKRASTLLEGTDTAPALDDESTMQLYTEIIRLSQKSARLGAIAASERVVANEARLAAKTPVGRFVENIQGLGISLAKSAFAKIAVDEVAVEQYLTRNNCKIESSIVRCIQIIAETFDISGRSIPWDEGYPKVLFDTCSVQAVTKLEGLCTSIVTVAKSADSAQLLELVALCGSCRSSAFMAISRALESSFEIPGKFADDNQVLARQYARLENALLAKYVQDKSRSFKPIFQGALLEYTSNDNGECPTEYPKEVRPYATFLLAKLVSTASECVQSVPAFDSKILISGLIKQLGDQLEHELKHMNRLLTPAEVYQLDLELGFLSQALGGFETNSAKAAFESATGAVAALSKAEGIQKVKSQKWQSLKAKVFEEHFRKVRLVLDCFATS